MMTLRTVLFAIALVQFSFCHCQEYERVIVINDSTYFLSTTNKSEMKTKDTLSYYWLHNQTIGRTQGSYFGKLLDRKFYCINQDGNLILEGEFEDGIKNGSWKKWNKSGELVEELNYQDGLLEGSAFRVVNDSTRHNFEYKRGLLNGKYFEIVNDEVKRVLSYRKGKIKKDKNEN